jgi:NADH-quinone oxidoreductase subunit E
MLRRLYHDQPASFAFTPENRAWAEGQMTKYPEGRQASAIIPLLWRAQEQEGWLTRPAIEYVADMLGLAYMRALEVASFYFMFQLQPVGSVAHLQICGTTTCMICGAEDLVAVCREKIADKPHALSADGRFSWEEVECLGSCANAPMAQIGKDYYEDLTAKRLAEIIDELAAGTVPVPGPQNGRYASEPLGGLTSLKDMDSGKTQYNASVQLAVDIKDTIKRIDGTEVPLTTPWLGKPEGPHGEVTKQKSPVPDEDEFIGKPKVKPAATPTPPQDGAQKPKTLTAPRKGGADDLKQIKGVGPKLETMLNKMGFFHFDQIAAWTAAEVAWADENLEGFKGRVTRDDWVAQAAVLAEGGKTEFSNRANKGEV